MANNQTSFETLQLTLNYLKAGVKRILSFDNFQNSQHTNWKLLSQEVMLHSVHIDLNLINSKRHPYMVQELEKWIEELKLQRDEVVKTRNSTRQWRDTYDSIILGYDLLINEVQKKIPAAQELYECKTFLETLIVKDKYQAVGLRLDIGRDDDGFNQEVYFTFRSNKQRQKVLQEYQGKLQIALMQSADPQKIKADQFKTVDKIIKENQQYSEIFAATRKDLTKDYLKDLKQAEALGYVLGLVDFQNELAKELTQKEMGRREISNHKKLEITEWFYKNHLKDEFTDLDITTKDYANCGDFKKEGKLCDNCFFWAFTEKLIDLPHAKRKKFIDYQTSLREDKLTFLEEVSGMLNDYESQFNENDYKIASEFNTIIENKIQELKQPEETSNGATSDIERLLGIAQPTVYQLPENFKLTKQNIRIDRLDVYQSAILFYYLRNHKAIINYTDADLAEFVHYLTGHSEQNLRTKKGFGSIWDIITEERNGEKFFNAKVVKALLQDIINDIDSEVNKKK